MATYVTLIKFTEKGSKNIKDTCKRAADFRVIAKKQGIEVREQLWCMGAYDGILVFDAASDEAAAAGLVGLNALDNVTTQTFRSFTASEMTKILSAV